MGNREKRGEMMKNIYRSRTNENKNQNTKELAEAKIMKGPFYI
jgi:hypothetical protein